MAEKGTRGRRPHLQPVITVAELLNRDALRPIVSDVDEHRLAVSVGTLLRREGRAPHALDRPVQARGQQRQPQPSDEDQPSRVRRTALAAGTLLAASSVFGAAVLTDASGISGFTGTADGQEPAGGPLAAGGLALPADSPFRNGDRTSIVDLAALSDPPAAGIEPGSEWAVPRIPTQATGDRGMGGTALGSVG